MGTILFTNDNIGGAHAAALVLADLKRRGHKIISVAAEHAPSDVFLKKQGWDHRVVHDQLDWNDPVAFLNMNLLFKECVPDCVVVGFSDTNKGTEKTAVTVAHARGIPVIAILEGWPHRGLDSYGARELPIYQKASKICLADELSLKRMVKEGFSLEKLAVTGNPFNDALMSELPNRDLYRKEVRQHFDFADNAIVLGYMTTGDLDNLEEESPGHPEWVGHSEEFVLTEFLIGLEVAKWQYPKSKIEGFVRIKPNRKGKRVQKLIAELCPSCRFDRVDHQGKPKPIFASDAVIGRFTLMLEHASLFGIPTISYLPRYIGELPMANQLGIVHSLEQVKELGKCIVQIASDPQSALQKLRETQKERWVMPNATRTTATLIEEFLK